MNAGIHDEGSWRILQVKSSLPCYRFPFYLMHKLQASEGLWNLCLMLRSLSV